MYRPSHHPPRCWREPGHEGCAAVVLEAVVADAGIDENTLDWLASRAILPDPR